MKKRILIFLLLVLVMVQFIPALPENQVATSERSFTEVYEVPLDVEQILQSACYDCHSGSAKWPWYSRVAPLSFWIGHHVEEGRGHIDFTKWTLYEPEAAAHKLEEMAEEVAEGEMPLKSYTWMHAEARLSESQKERLINFFKGLQTEAHRPR
jgi:hypothetical protein